MKRLVALCAVLMLAACGETPTDANGDGIADEDPRSPDTVTGVAPSSPKGRVTGRVVDSQGRPLSEVEVVVSTKEAPRTLTNGEGMFSVDKITGGSTVGLVLSKPGFASAFTTVIVPGSTGNFPLNDGEAFAGTIGLVGNNGELTFSVVGYDGALVAAPAGVMDVLPGALSFSDSSTSANPRGGVNVSATGADGVLKFTGIPKVEEMARLKTLGIDARYIVYLPPVYSANTLLYAGHTVSLTATDLLTKPWIRNIVLPAPADQAALKVEASNVTSLVKPETRASENLVPVNGPIMVVFNQRIAPGTFVAVYDDNSKEAADHAPIPLDVISNNVGNQLAITPKTSFTVGQKYFITLQASALDGSGAGRILSTSASFFVGDPALPLRPAPTARFIDEDSDLMLAPTEKIEIDFAHYIGKGDGDIDGFMVPVYLDRTNLGGQPDLADFEGEKGSGKPKCVFAAEATPKNGSTTGYARRAKGTGSSLGVTVALDVTGVQLTIPFGEAGKCGGLLYTVWGELLTGESSISIGQ